MIKNFLICALNATPIKAARSKNVLDFMLRESGILQCRDKHIYWVHKSFEEYLAAKGFAQRIEMEEEDFRSVVEKWKQPALERTIGFFLEMNTNHNDFEDVIDGILEDERGSIFLLTTLAEGLQLGEQRHRELAGFLRFAANQEYEGHPETLCSKILYGYNEYISLLMKLSTKEHIFRDESINLLCDEEVVLDFRMDVLHSMRSELMADDLQKIAAAVPLDSWKKMNDWGRLQRINQPISEMMARIWRAGTR